ncbi:MAG TPA: flavohemoglobin expression-modulating QEGLA motif protein [Acidimicrobiales bacterium]|nr:flavohemoglobin expression-modulating QEGLA motif protein [Acidimicrobiales bacterium]
MSSTGAPGAEATAGRAANAEVERYRAVAHRLHEIAKPMRVLSALRWPASVREEFLAGGADALPSVEYPRFDDRPIVEAVGEIRRSIYPGELIDDWLESVANSLEHTARMLAARGTESFLTHNRALYGTPHTPLRYDPTTPYELAQRVHEVLLGLDRVGLSLEVPRDHSAQEVADILSSGVIAHFGPDDAPAIKVVDELSANALATASRIKVRAGARFTARDAAQLLNHEAFIHVLTAVNGRHQTDLPILAIGHPGTTRTQEGLAVFAEFVSGTLELNRFRRLADRVLGVQMVMDGADFVELFRWFSDQSPSPEQAFESTRRIFRGGPVTGGAPFTKDCVYLSGFLAVSTFIRAAFVQERLDCVGTLFVGKLDLFDIPALVELRRLGLCRSPVHRPPWVLDPGWALTWLTYSTFVSAIDLAAVSRAVGHLLDRVPQLDTGGSTEAGSTN